MSSTGTPAERKYFEHRGLKLSYLDSAPNDASRPVVVLLHGFPDDAQMWSHLMPELHENGYRVLAPDTVGNGQSEIAPRLKDYDAQAVAGDFVALLDHLSIDKAFFVGHDWGAVLGWFTAIYHPGRVRRFVAVSVGHPTAYGRAGFKQKLLGWYVLYFQFAGLAERLLLGHGPLSLRRLCSSHPEIEYVMRRVSEPGRLTAAIRLYRANLYNVLVRAHPDSKVPTLGIWSDNDGFLTESQMTHSQRHMDAEWQYQRLGGGHWIPLEQPARLNQLILGFIQDPEN